MENCRVLRFLTQNWEIISLLFPSFLSCLKVTSPFTPTSHSSLPSLFLVLLFFPLLPPPPPPRIDPIILAFVRPLLSLPLCVSDFNFALARADENGRHAVRKFEGPPICFEFFRVEFFHLGSYRMSNRPKPQTVPFQTITRASDSAARTTAGNIPIEPSSLTRPSRILARLSPVTMATNDDLIQALTANTQAAANDRAQQQQKHDNLLQALQTQQNENTALRYLVTAGPLANRPSSS